MVEAGHENPADGLMATDEETLEFLARLAKEQAVQPQFSRLVRTGPEEWTCKVEFPGLKIPVNRVSRGVIVMTELTPS